MNALHRTYELLLMERAEQKRETEEALRWRPCLHVAPPFGWLNDPNGLCQYQGVYHAFYQFAPFQVEGGLKFWAHSTSTDLLHWKDEGVFLSPDQPYDCHGVYSGSALIEEDGMYLYYTGNVKLLGDYDYVSTGRESNTVLAVSRDGQQMEYKELLMKNEDYPEDLTNHVRDPKVWKQDGMYYMVQGARTKEDKGVVLVFSSSDRKNWKYIHRLEMKEPFGFMWECPDLYELDGHTVLSISPQGLEQKGLLYANVYQSGTCILEGDFRTCTVPENFRELDAGFDFYAPQSFLTEDGRRVLIGWMGMPDVDEYYTNRTIEHGWQHVLTFPRELSVRDGIVCQNPVRELADWWNWETEFRGEFRGELDSCCEIELNHPGSSMRIVLAEGLELRYDGEEKIFWMEFTDKSLGAGRTIRGREVEKLEDVKVLVDASCVEVFINGGRDVFSTRFYPKQGQYTVEITMETGSGMYRSHK
ncbi:MAG: glycoside hydrolase family 32 protein [Clostridiales bacterium]|nr:glycoside hydrolase family 32 protein [Clostridiales bacterium]